MNKMGRYSKLHQTGGPNRCRKELGKGYLFLAAEGSFLIAVVEKCVTVNLVIYVIRGHTLITSREKIKNLTLPPPPVTRPLRMCIPPPPPRDVTFDVYPLPPLPTALRIPLPPPSSILALARAI